LNYLNSADDDNINSDSGLWQGIKGGEAAALNFLPVNNFRDFAGGIEDLKVRRNSKNGLIVPLSNSFIIIIPNSIHKSKKHIGAKYLSGENSPVNNIGRRGIQ